MKPYLFIYLLFIGLSFSNYNYQSQKDRDIVVLLNKMICKSCLNADAYKKSIEFSSFKTQMTKNFHIEEHI